jgi:hypothetical protein
LNSRNFKFFKKKDYNRDIPDSHYKGCIIYQIHIFFYNV